MRWAAHRENWLETFHTTIASAKESMDKARCLILAPRDHGKTEAAVTLTSWAICTNRDIRVLWISESLGQAEKRMRRVKSLLESERVVEDWCSSPESGFGPFLQADTDRWMATQVYVARQLNSVDPTLEAVGSGGAITGGHFDLIICDDIEDDKTVYTQGQRQKTREWFRGTIGPMLVRGGTMIVIGTRKHHGDLYGHMLTDPTWRVISDKAILTWPDKYRFELEKDARGREVITGVIVEGEPEVLWPEERDIEYLLRERQAIGQVLFSREFQNEVQDDSAAAFRMAWLKAAMERGKDLSFYEIPDVTGLDVVQGWDLALVTDAKHAENRDTDYTVGITWARDNDGNRYLMGIRRERGLTPAQLEGIVKHEFHKFGLHVRNIAVEKNNFGELIYLGLQKSTDLPLKPHITTGRAKADPWEGVPSLSVLFENGKVILPSKTKEDREMLEPLINELWGLGRETHDDTVMSLWIAETVLRKSSFVHRVSFDDNAEFNAAADDRLRQLYGEDAQGEVLDDEDATNPLSAFWATVPWRR
jgi:phage terminase large subunit-like protein